jgi:hypothetical protein
MPSVQIHYEGKHHASVEGEAHYDHDDGWCVYADGDSYSMGDLLREVEGKQVQILIFVKEDQ